MTRAENPQVELMEVVGSWGFDPDYRGPQEAYPVGNGICVLPNSEEACPITGTRPLTVTDGKDEDYEVPAREPRVLGQIDDLTTRQRIVFSKFGPWSLISGAEIFPDGYLEDKF